MPSSSLPLSLKMLSTLTALLLLLLSCIAVEAAVVPGRMLNKDHEEIFAQQAKEIARTKQRERKPFLACPAGLIPCLSNGEANSIRDDIYECVDVQASLQSCGGCSLKRTEDGDFANGDGTDCTALPNVKGVECMVGRCVITACKVGYRQTSLGCV